MSEKNRSWGSSISASGWMSMPHSHQWWGSFTAK